MNYAWVGNQAEACEAADVLAHSAVIACDVETTGLDALAGDILLLTLRGEEGPTYISRLPYTPLLNVLAARVVVAHNAAFEYEWLKVHTGVALERLFCTQVAEGLLTAGLMGDDRRASLERVVKKYCGVALDKGQQESFIGVNPRDFVPTGEQLAYAALDVRHLHDVMAAQLHALAGEEVLRVARLEAHVVQCLGDMELAGFTLDTAAHAKVLAVYTAREAALRAEVLGDLNAVYQALRVEEEGHKALLHKHYQDDIETVLPGGRIKKDTPQEVKDRVRALRKVRDEYKTANVEALNLNSNRQVWATFKALGVELYKDVVSPRGLVVRQPSVDKFTIEEHKHEHSMLEKYAAWQKNATVVERYGDGLAARVHERTGRVHGRYNQLVDSGRLSSSGPNMQQMPPDVRTCFVAAPGHLLVVADAQNQEGRIAAALSGDESLLRVFREGQDWHKLTAAAAWPELYKHWQDVPKDSKERARAKNANFSSIYGGSAHTLKARRYVDDLATGERLMAAIAANHPRLVQWAQETANHAVAHGWVATASGRKRYFKVPPKPAGKEDFRAWKRAIGGIRRAAMNHPVQGTGADIMKQAMVLIRRRTLRTGCPYVQLVAMAHDEFVYEVHESYAGDMAKLVDSCMLEAASYFITALPIPADVHITKEWRK